MSVAVGPSIDPRLLESLVENAPEGVAISEGAGERRVVYANAAMERLTGYSRSELQGRNLSFLQAHDREQEGVTKIREALQQGEPCETVVRNYRRDGTMFWNRVTIRPLRDAQGAISHYASFHREVGESQLSKAGEPRDPTMNTQTMLAYLRDDKLTGLLRRQYFEELVRRDWALAQRESRRLCVLLFELDCFDQYREVFGRAGADQAFRRIARVMGGCFRRASDLCGRFDEDQIVAVTSGMDLAQASKLAEAVLTRVRDLAIHHPRSPVSRFVTASAGVVSLVPAYGAMPEHVFESAAQALNDAKQLGRNRVVSRECD
jgi:diguanylate cyclase (GGDEF)-like protein/PAS domain S-box-containing protein